MPPSFWMSSVASSSTTSTMSSTVTMPRMRPSGSTTGTAIRSWLAISRATASWSMFSGTEITSRSITSSTRRSAAAENSSRTETTPRSRCSASRT